MRNPKNGHMMPRGHLAYGLEYAPDIGILVTIDRAHVRADGVDLNDANILFSFDVLL